MKNENKNSNSCAYPASAEIHTDGGLTKREYFAGLALQALISTETYDFQGRDSKISEIDIGDLAVKLADSLLESLQPPQTKD